MGISPLEFFLLNGQLSPLELYPRKMGICPVDSVLFVIEEALQFRVKFNNNRLLKQFTNIYYYLWKWF